MTNTNLSSRSPVVGYVDGYNVYYGLRSKGWRRFYWLDLRALFAELLEPGEVLAAVKYFTARRRGPLDSNSRQTIYLGAHTSYSGVEVIYGKFAMRAPQHCSCCGSILRCPGCKRPDRRTQEKMTDVALGVNMVADAYEGLYEKAFLMSGDADFVTAVRHVVGRLGKEVIVTPPPGRQVATLKKAASGVAHFPQGAFGRSQLPEVVTGDNGKEYRRPPEWA